MNSSETVKDTSRHACEPETAILLLGNGDVGKTTLARALTGELFDPNEAVTHGVNVSDFEGVSLVDFPGQAVYNDTIKEEIAGHQPIAAIVVARSRSSDTTSDIDHWCSRLREYCDREDLPKFLVITMSDLCAVDVDEKYLTRKHGFIGIYRTSAKERTGIQELRSAIRNVVVGAEEELDGGLSEIAKIVRTMADCLCELVAKNPRALDEIEWRDLERLLARAVEELGFTVELTPPAKDGGKDLVASCIVEGERMTYYIEVKHWKRGGAPRKTSCRGLLGGQRPRED